MIGTTLGHYRIVELINADALHVILRAGGGRPLPARGRFPYLE
jgi:hypothetical protein